MDKKQIIIAIVILAVGVAIGRFTLPAKVVTITETKEVVKVVKEVVKEVNKDTVTTITETTDCSTGKKTVVTVITDKSKTVTESTTQKDKDSSTESSATTTYAKNDLMISALVGTDALQNLSSSNILVFGAHVQKRLIGPIWIGAFGYSNKMVGGSIGLTF